MEWEKLKIFFTQYPDLKEDKPGLYRLLMYPFFREKYKVSMEEAEHLAEVEITGPANASTLAWTGELLRYREKQK